VAGRSRVAVTHVEEQGMRMEYATRGTVWLFGTQNHLWPAYGFEPQNSAEVPRKNG
jgi:hypothetical protein